MTETALMPVRFLCPFRPIEILSFFSRFANTKLNALARKIKLVENRQECLEIQDFISKANVLIKPPISKNDKELFYLKFLKR